MASQGHRRTERDGQKHRGAVPVFDSMAYGLAYALPHQEAKKAIL